MPDRTLRISRRKLLQIAGVAPLTTLIARDAGAAPCDPATDVDKRVIDVFWALGHTHNGQVDEAHFRAVAKMLWLYFEAGARAGGKCVPDNVGLKVALATPVYVQKNRCDQRSGDLITDSMATWDPNDVTTNGCAYLCGVYTAEAALAAGTEINPSAYEAGYKRTEAQMKDTLKRLRARQGDESKDCPSRGAGC